MKKLFSLLLVFAMLISLPVFAFARNENVVISTSGKTNQVGAFGYYSSVTVRAGVNAVLPAVGFEIEKALIVEPGATLTGTAGSGQFNFSIRSADAVISGIDLYYYHDDRMGNITLHRIAGGYPAVAALDCWDFAGGWCPGFKWDDGAGCWVLSEVLNGNPFGDIVTYHSERDMDCARQCADLLNHLGLFKGTGIDASGNPVYELDRTGSRLEALVMLIRLLGKESEALSGSWSSPFTDVPDWAKPYVGYAYETGLTAGISATRFGTGTATAQMYMTFLLRALGYTDEDVDTTVWAEALELAARLGITENNDSDVYIICLESGRFWRSDMVVASKRALEINTRAGVRLADVLIADGVFPADHYRP